MLAIYLVSSFESQLIIKKKSVLSESLSQDGEVSRQIDSLSEVLKVF